MYAALTQGIKNHKFVDPFVHPGTTDLSANVDFSLMANLKGFQGPITQCAFLDRMGAKVRLAKLAQGKSPTTSAALTADLNRLMSMDGYYFAAVSDQHSLSPF